MADDWERRRAIEAAIRLVDNGRYSLIDRGRLTGREVIQALLDAGWSPPT